MAQKPAPRQHQRRTFFREWREHRGLTQEQAAERIGLSQATLSRIERGSIRYGQDFLEAAAFAYMCEPADLIMRNPLQADAVWSIHENLLRATPEQRDQIDAVIAALLRKAS